MHVDLLFPSLYLKAADLQGRDVRLTIDHLQVEELKTERGSEKKPVLYFFETAEKAKRTGEGEKRLVLNKTNAKTIAKLYGAETNDWKGQPIDVYPTSCQSFGQTAECIRVRPKVPTNGRGKKQDSPPPGEE